MYGDDTIYTVVFYLEYATSACYSSKVPLSDFFLVELTRCLRGTRRTRCELRLFPDMLVRVLGRNNVDVSLGQMNHRGEMHLRTLISSVGRIRYRTDELSIGSERGG